MVESVTLQSKLLFSARKLSEVGIPTALLDSEVLISHVLGIDKTALIIDQNKKLSEIELEVIDSVIERRRLREPVAYITGVKEFYSLDFKVNSSVLIPRPETELLVDLAIYHAPKESDVLDLCTGSGAVAVALKFNRSDLNITASDISPEALVVAAENANRILGNEKISFVKSNLFKNLAGQFYSLIVTNPPYISRKESHLLEKELFFEPDIALFTEDDSFSIVSQIIYESVQYLLPGGMMIMEIGYNMKDFVEARGCENGYSVSVGNDFSGKPRIATFVKF